jgi:glucosamine--fructose-6-phosphate aminotransferase (isomerizing)
MVKSYGRRLAAVVKEDDHEITGHADFVIPVVGEVREAFSPLIYHVAADYFSCFLTETLGRHLFQSDNEPFMEANRQFLARDRIR